MITLVREAICMTLETEIKGQIQEYEIHLSERIGQHMLVDEEALDIFTEQIVYGANVLEVGSGTGNITERAAARANKVIGIEIDRRFQPRYHSAVLSLFRI